MITKIKNFIAKETVLCIAAACAVLTMFLVPPDMEYIHYIDFRVLALLLCLMAVVAGFKSVGAFLCDCSMRKISIILSNACKNKPSIQLASCVFS